MGVFSLGVTANARLGAARHADAGVDEAGVTAFGVDEKGVTDAGVDEVEIVADGELTVEAVSIGSTHLIACELKGHTPVLNPLDTFSTVINRNHAWVNSDEKLNLVTTFPGLFW